MDWFKMSGNFADHPKVHELSDKAFRAHVLALCYVARQETDGLYHAAGVSPRYVRELVAAGLWVVVGDGFEIHDWSDYMPAKADMQGLRDLRQEAGRRGGVASGAARREASASSKREASASALLEPEKSREEVEVEEPTTKTDLRSVPDANPNQPTHDQLYLAERLSERLTPGVVVNLNKRFGRGEVTDVLRSMHGFPGVEIGDVVAYLTGILNARAEAM